MSKLRIFYIVSLVILGVLVFNLLRPMATGGNYSEVSREHLLRTEDKYIVEFNIMNHEGEDKSYTINVLIDGKLYSEDVLILDGKLFTYSHHIYPDRITEGNVRFAIYKEGEAVPFEEITYYLN